MGDFKGAGLGALVEPPAGEEEARDNLLREFRSSSLPPVEVRWPKDTLRSGETMTAVGRRALR